MSNWIAKNSITGTTYGKAFDSIWDCQAFIDNSLKLLEYEFQRSMALEHEFLSEIELCNKTKEKGPIEMIGMRIQFAIQDFTKQVITEKTKMEFEKCFADKKTQREIDNKLMKYVKTNWLKNNIIRCYNVSQKRWADGFDF